MKPRLFKFMQLWYCALPGLLSGLGYKPADAYAEWFKRNGCSHETEGHKSGCWNRAPFTPIVTSRSGYMPPGEKSPEWPFRMSPVCEYTKSGLSSWTGAALAASGDRHE